MTHPTNKCIRFHRLLALLSAFLIVGCTGLGQRKSTSAFEQMAKPQKMKSWNQDSGSKLAKNVRKFLPGRKKVNHLVPDDPIAKDDPTRLDRKDPAPTPGLYLAAARLSERTGAFPTALEQYESALKLDQTNREALIALARLQQKIGRNDAAVQSYRRALDHYPNDATIMNDLGLCFARNRQLDEAVAMLGRAVEQAPNRNMYLNNLAAALVESNRTDEAVARLAERLGPDTANYRVGYLLSQAGRTEMAEVHLTRTLEINPQHTAAREMLGQRNVRMSSLPR